MQPTPYDRIVDFTAYAGANPSAPYNAADHDSEFDAVEVTLDGICDSLAAIQRDDGGLKNRIVTPQAFDTAALALIGATWLPRGLWATATSYAVGDVVENSGISYVCAQAHSSGTFATDHAAGKWVVLGSAFGAAQVTDLTVTGSITIGASNDLHLVREAAGILAQRDGTNNQTLRIYSTYTDDLNYERLRISFQTPGSAAFIMTDQAGTGSARQLILGTKGAADLVFRTNDTARFNFNSSGHFLASTDNTYDIGASGATRPRNIYVAGFVNAASLVSTNWMAVADGISAPSAQVGQARIYVDTADGDLKVIFGDGTIKTIVVDT